MEAATSHGKIACAVFVLTGFEEVQVLPWLLDSAVRMVVSSDHAYQI